MSIFFTADLHIGHTNILYLQHRPFSSISEMNETIIENWNSTVDSKDTVYLLGDVGLCNSVYLAKYLIRLHGTIHLIPGNHDKAALKIPNHFASINPLLNIQINKQFLTLCHYPMRSWLRCGRKSFHLHGHWHTQDHTEYRTRIGNYRMLDVGVDGWGYRPVRYETVYELLHNLQDTQ